MPPLNSPDSRTQYQALGFFVRIYWMLGNIVLIFSASCIALNRGGVLTPVDGVFWSGVFSLVMFRYLDIQHFSSRTFTGKTASMPDFRRYTLRILVASTAIWGLAHGAAFLIAL